MPVPGGGGGGGVRRHNRSMSGGVEQRPGGWGKTETCPGGITNLSLGG